MTKLTRCNGTVIAEGEGTMAELASANLTNLCRARLARTNLSRVDLAHANLACATVTRADLTRTELTDANLSGADFRCTNLSQAYMARANLSGANLTRANFTQAYMAGANLSGVNLTECIGNGREIITTQTDLWTVTRTADVMQIGCTQHPIEKWWAFSDEEITAMDICALDWWRAWKHILRQMIAVFPAVPTGHMK